MKPKTIPFLNFRVAAVTTFTALSLNVSAADRIKQNNTTNLNLAGSWDVVPTAADVAVFDTVYATTGALNTGALVTWQGLRVASPGGNVVINNSTAGQEVALGSAGMNLSAATVNLSLQRPRVDASQTWNVATGRIATIGNSAAARTGVLGLGTGGPYTITKTGAGTVQLDTSNTAIGNVNWDVQGGLIRAIWNGSSSWGTGTITLGGGGIAVGTNFTGSVGNWTWNNNIALTASTASFIDNQNNAGTDRWLKLANPISGSGNLEFRDTGTGFTNSNYGFILAGSNANSGSVTILSGAEVRVGSTTSNDANTGNNGKLAADSAAVVNNGTLTFSRLDAHTVANNISGSGTLRIGLSATVGTATTSQVVNLTGSNTYTGATSVINGRLALSGSLTSAVNVSSGATLSGTGSTTGSLTMAANSGFMLNGGSTLNGLVVNGVTINGATTVSFASNPTPATTYDVVNYGATGIVGFTNLTAAWRGTLQNDAINQKVTFTTGDSATRTWTTTSGTWDNTGTNQNWAEGDLKFYDGDSAVFGDIASNATITLSGSIAASSAVVQNSANAYTFAGGALSGAASLTKSNAGSLIITNSNTNTGSITILGGVIDVGNGGAAGNLGSGAIAIASGSELVINRSNAATLSNSISGEGLVTKKGAGRLTVNGNSSSGVVNWNFTGTGNGDIAFQNANATGGSGSSLSLQASATGSVFFGTTGNVSPISISLATGSTLTWNGSTGNTNTISGSLSGSGNFTKVSGETLILTGSSNYSGNITVSAGTLQIGGAGTLNGQEYSGNIVNSNVFAVNSSIDQTFSGAISGTGRLEKSNTGVLTISGNNTYTGGTELLGGTLAIDALSRLGTRTASLDATGYLAIKQGGTLRYTGVASESTTRRLFMDNGAATIDVVNADTTLTWDDDSNVAKTGNFTKAGAGTLALADPLTGGSQTITVNGGSLILTGANTNGGGVTINSGILEVNNNGRLGAGAIVNDGQLRFFYGGGVNVVMNQAISGSGSLLKTGAGSLSLTGFVSSSGPITAQGGTLRLQNELAADVTFEDGSTLATGTNAAIGFAASGVTGSLTLAGGSNSVFRIDAGTNHDRFYIDQENQFSITGTHVITPVLVGTPAADEAFPVFDYVGSLQGNFSDFQLPPGTRFELVNNTQNTSIDLVYKGGELLWTGGTGDWDIDLTPNWSLAGSSTNFFAADRALFDDTATTGNVNLVGAISPFTTKFQNSTLGYTLSGAALSGTGSVIKDGSAATTFLIPSSYSGTTTVNAGKLRIGDGGTNGDIGSGAVQVAAGATLEFNRSNAIEGVVDLDYKTTAKLRNVSGAGEIVLTGGGILFNYPGIGSEFAEANSWNQFSGSLKVKGNSEFRTIRNGATAMGSGSIVLGDATSSGNLAQIEGSWTWTNPIVLEGANNAIINRSATIVGGRSHKLQGVISGAGGLRLRDATASMTDINKGYVLTAANTLTGTLTIDSGVPLRIGGVPGDTNVSQLSADAAGSLGAATVVNDGTLTFSRTDAHTVTNAISGSGAVRVGIPSAANLGDTSTQVVTYSGQGSYTGSTTVNNGTLLLASGASIGGSSLSVASTGTLGGAGTVTAAVQIAGTVAPGTGVATLTLGNTTLSGTYACDLSGSQSDRLITGDLNLTGSTLQITGTPTAASYTIASYTGALTGNFSGTLPEGYEISTATAGEIRLVQSGTDFDNWISGFFPNETNAAIIGLNADPDGDGVPNGIEFVLKNGNPAQGNSTIMPTATRSGDTLLFTFERDDRAKGPNAGMTLSVEAGDTLQTWPKSYVIGATSQAPVTISNDTDSGPDTVTVAIPLEGATSQYARLKVTAVTAN